MKIDVNTKISLRQIVGLFFVISLPIVCVGGISPLPFLIRTPIIYAMGIVAGIYIVLGNINLKLNTVTCLYFLFLIYLAVSLGYSYDSEMTLHYFLIYLCLFPLLFIDFTENLYEKITKVTLIVATVFALSIIISVPIENCMDRYFWFIVNPSRSLAVSDGLRAELEKGSYSGFAREIANAAFTMNVGIAIQFSKFFVKGRLNLKETVILIILIAGLLLTGKRMMLLITVLIFMFLLLITEIKGKAGKIVITTFVILLSVFMILMFSPALANTFIRFTDTENISSMGNRDVLWEYSYMMIEKYWLFGAGFASYNTYAFDHGMSISGGKWEYFNHNIYYQALGELGIIGCLFIFGFTIIALVKTIYLLRNKKLNDGQQRMMSFSLFIQLMILIYGISGNPIYSAEIICTWIFSIAVYLSVSGKVIEKRQKQFGYMRRKDA